MNTKPQILKQDGKPAFVVLPIEEWERILDRIEDLEDEAAIRDFHERGERTYPAEVVYAVLDGANPIKVYREWRGLTQAELADSVGIAKLYLSQIETGRRTGSTKVLRALARALDVDLDLLVGDRPSESNSAGTHRPAGRPPRR